MQPLHGIKWDGGWVEDYKPPFMELIRLRTFVMEQVAMLREDHMRPINPTPYKVSLSEELYNKLHSTWLEACPIPDID